MKYVPLYVGFFGVGHTRQVTAAKNSVRRDLSLQLTSGQHNNEQCACVCVQTHVGADACMPAHRYYVRVCLLTDNDGRMIQGQKAASVLKPLTLYGV